MPDGQKSCDVAPKCKSLNFNSLPEKREDGKKEKIEKTDVYNGIQPKRPLSCYMIFNSENFAKIKEGHPDMSATDVIRETGKRWGALTEKEKVPYQKKADLDKAR